MSEAVFARCISAIKEEASHRPGKTGVHERQDRAHRSGARLAVCVATIVRMPRGLRLCAPRPMQKWNLHFGEISMIWRVGCISSASRRRSLATPAAEPAPRSVFQRHCAAHAEQLAQDRGRGRVLRVVGVFRQLPQPGSRGTCTRPRAIISAPTPTSAPTRLAGNSSTTTGSATGSRATFNTPHAQCASPSATPKTATATSFLTGKSCSASPSAKLRGNSPHRKAANTTSRESCANASGSPPQWSPLRTKCRD